MNHEPGSRFSGFSHQTLDFIHTLKEKNSKAWFQEKKHLYQACLVEPLQDLVSDLGEFMLTIDPFFEIRPAIDKTISRIYRDTRFSKDKSLFKNNMWITFKRPIKDWKDAPCYYFEIFPNWYRYGMGYYSASRATMVRFREAIDGNPGEFLDVISFFKKQNLFQLEGEKYKRLIENHHPPEIDEWYQWKSFYLACNREIDEVLFSRKLVDELIFGFMMLKPLYQYLMNLKK
ncbi:MAG: DUF2461 domain-containing protein [bacterium]|nr:MAG: DUF2461 domain-containing protein [bacterium]